MKPKHTLLSLTFVALAALTLSASAQNLPDPLPVPDDKPADMSKPVKVFILLGQSNMLGFGAIGPEEQKGTLSHLVKQEGKFTQLVDDDGNWTKRNDVRYVQVMHNNKFQLMQNDWLTVGKAKIGPELQFGHIMGQLLDEPVLVLKSCIGNRSLGWDLLPPGSERYIVDGTTYAGYKDTPDKWIEGEPKKEVPWYAGKQYDDDVANAKTILENLGEYYPGATQYEVAGFVWWQGHKDQNPVHAARYEQNLVRLIKSLRNDFNAPKAPFALATIAFGGWELAGNGLTIANAQLAISDPEKHPEFAGNVKTVEARDFWRKKEDSPNQRQDYHYWHNAGTYMDVGDALGRAMAGLLEAGK